MNDPDAAPAAANPIQSGLGGIWAAWRAAYVTGETGDNVASPHSSAAADPANPDASIFENLVAADEPDENTLIVWRGELCFAVLNLFPYCTGHLLVMPNRAACELDELNPAELDELWLGVRRAVKAIQVAYQPEGVNVGINLGRAAGAGIPDHLHVHCLPRWSGDTNFMTSVAQTRILPEDLSDSWTKLRRAWPSV